MPRLCALLFLAAGCGSAEIVDVWSGDCFISYGGDEIIYAIELDIDSDEKGEVGGTALFDLTGLGDLSEVGVSGTRKGKDLELELDVADDTLGIPVTLELIAKVKGDEMTGECVLRTFGVGVSGDLTLARGALSPQESGTKTVP